MFARYSGTLANPILVSAVILTLAAISLVAVPAHGFDLKPTWQDGMKAATDDLNSLGKEDSAEKSKSPGQERTDREINRLAGKAAGKIERGMWKAGEKAWKRLEKTKTLGPTLKKLGKRWGHAAKMGTRLSPHVATALTVWDFTYAVGNKLIAPKVVSAIERGFENKWKEQEEELRRDMEHYRKLGEQRRQHKKDVLDVLAVGHALRQLREDKRGPWATKDDPWGEDGKEANNPAPGAKDPWAKDDPWALESPDVRFARPVAVQPAQRPVASGESGTAASDYRQAPEQLEADHPSEQARASRRAARDPWAPDTSETASTAPVAAGVATPPVAAKEIETGPSNYEKALNGLQGGSTRSVGYEKALEKLETEHRVERARRQEEAEATRRRHAARTAEEKRVRAERDEAARRESDARERERRQALDRAARERRQYSTPSYNPGYNQTTHQINRAMQTLRQTRQQQQRSYQIQKARQQEFQRQQRLEQARRQRIYEQQRTWDRRTYQTYEAPPPRSSRSRSSSRGSSGRGGSQQ